MPQVNIFRWRTGRGLLVLAGGGSWNSHDNQRIEARMLQNTFSQGPIAYIWAASGLEQADRHMDALRDLGARTGYLLDILTEPDEDLSRQLSEAGVIILGDGAGTDTLREALVGVAMNAIESAYLRGSTLYAIGQSAAILGAYAIQGDQLVAGFSWLSHAIMLAGYTPDDAETLRAWVHDYPDDYGLGLGEGAALALDPRGGVEVWGNTSITVSLGQNYGSDAL
jgi:hypothetical protein